ncbi:MAG: sodium:solute symporter family protein [Acidobacteriota bacterium]|nr:sodium:solute symporter family protein [Acidobacteriota bacterium]
MRISLGAIDYAILAAYFLFVVAVGWLVRRRVRTSEDFLTSHRSVPLWITSLAFIAANLGAQEVMGMCASGAKYGLMTVHFYWIGAIPAMIFVGVFMMPFYYGSRARSVPEYLKLRFDEKTRALNAASFAVMTVFSSGISLYALGKLFQLLLGWTFEQSVLLSAAVVLAYTFLGGLTSAIYNEVLQFFLIVIGFSPLAAMAVNRAGGWAGMSARLPPVMTHAWKFTGSAAANPMGVEAFGLIAGLGFVLSFGYWCTDFLVVQRAMAAKSMSAARRTPLIAAFPKMVMPFIVILPGIAAIALTQMNMGYTLPVKGSAYDYDQALTTLMIHFYPSGLMGLGLTALMASFMSGMAGNVTAFNTVFTYDLYQSYVRPHADDNHYLRVARWTTLGGVALSIAAAYLAQRYNNIMDVLQLVFSFVNAPLFATFLLGMFSKRTTGHGAFAGLLSGTAGAALVHGLTVAEGKGGWIAPVHEFPSTMAQNLWMAIFAWSTCFAVTLLVSLATRPRPVDELRGLVYSLTPRVIDSHESWYRRPAMLAIIVGTCVVLLNLIYW